MSVMLHLRKEFEVDASHKGRERAEQLEEM